MSPNPWRIALVLGATLVLEAGAQTATPIRADFQNEVHPTAGYTGTTDVTINVQDEQSQGDENGNYHSQQELFADGFPVRQSSLMHFQVDGGQVPAGSVITGANLEFFVTKDTSTGFSAYEVLRPWDEGQATYLKPMDNQSWAVPGAAGEGVDRSAVPFSTFSRVGAGGYVLLGVTDAGVDLVRRWFAGAEPNNGLIVQDYDSWDEMRWSSADNTASPPYLVVHFNGTSARIKATDDTMIGYQPAGSLDGWGLGFSGRPNTLTSSFIRWDVSAIPPGVKITNAGIAFTVNRLAADAGAPPVDVYPALLPWTEQATWFTYDGTNPWFLPGAGAAGLDYGPKKGSFPPTCSTPQSLCSVSFLELQAIVQRWVDDPTSNHGLFLQNYLNNDDLQLMDSEWPVPGQRPKLSVAFSWDAGRPPGLYPAYAEVYPSESVPMKAFGGSGPYAFSVSGPSGATIDQAGNYTAGLFAGQDQVRVVDQGGAGTSAYATIVVLTNASNSPITISFPNPSPPVKPLRNFSVTAAISSRTVSPVSGLVLEVSAEALNVDGATLVGGGRLTGTPDAGFLLPVLDTGATLQVAITGAMRAVPTDNPSVTAAVRSGPVVVAKATTPVPLDTPPAISTGCNCGPTSGGMGVVLLAGILQMAARRRASKPDR